MLLFVKILVEENFTDFPGTFIRNLLHRDEHIVTHVLITDVFEHTLVLTVAIGNETLQTQQLVFAIEMGSVDRDSRHHDITMTSVHQQIRDVTFQILPYYGNCVVSCASRNAPDLDLN